MENIKINKYNTRDILITIENYDGNIDKLNFVVEDVMKKVVFKKSLENGITKISDNEYVISILAEDTRDMNALYKYTYFVEILINGVEVVNTSKEGVFRIEESSTDLREEIENYGKNND